MSDMVPFEFEGAAIRVVQIDGEPWFVGKDVTDRLGYTNAADAISTHCKGVAKRYPLKTPGGTQEIRVLSEPDVLRLIVKSSLPAAERFERWVFEDVLPTIRKTGSYGGVPAIDVRDPSQLANITMQLIGVNKELEARAASAEAQVEALKPKTQFFDQFVSADGLYGIQNAARAIGAHPNKFASWLGRKYTFYQGGVAVAYTQYRQMGLFEVKNTIVDDKARPRTFITPKGLEYFSTRIPPELKLSGHAWPTSSHPSKRTRSW